MFYDPDQDNRRQSKWVKIILTILILNFCMVGYATINRPKVRVQISKEHAAITARLVRIEQKLDRLEKKP